MTCSYRHCRTLNLERRATNRVVTALALCVEVFSKPTQGGSPRGAELEVRQVEGLMLTIQKDAHKQGAAGLCLGPCESANHRAHRHAKASMRPGRGRPAVQVVTAAHAGLGGLSSDEPM